MIYLVNYESKILWILDYTQKRENGFCLENIFLLKVAIGRLMIKYSMKEKREIKTFKKSSKIMDEGINA